MDSPQPEDQILLQRVTEILLILFGAIVGFGVERIKTLFDRRTYKRQLQEELATNLRMLPFFRQHVTEALAAAKLGHSPNMRAVHFCTACYDAHFSTVLPILTSAEQISFQIIYEYLRICNETTDALSTVVFSTSDQQEYSRQLRLYSGKLQAVSTMTQDTEKHIRQHLQGSPTNFLDAK